MKIDIQDSQELVSLISSFKGIITARLHSCIVAYSLDVPAIAISWTKKVADFFALIKQPDRAIDIENLNVNYIMKVFEKNMNREYDKTQYKKLKEEVTIGVSNMLNYISK